MTNSPNIMNQAVVASWQPMEESMTAIDRRKLMVGGAIGAAGVTLAAVPALAAGVLESAPEGGELARLVHRYFAEVAAFKVDPRLDDDDFFSTDQPFDATLEQMIGVPVRCPEDGLAAVEWLIEEGSQDFTVGGDSLFDQIATSIVTALRDYLAKQVRA
jgi:hypothetical protein